MMQKPLGLEQPILLIFWESLASFKKRFGICMPVTGHMKVVLLDPYRAEDTEPSATSKFKHVSICRQWMHHWQMLCLVSYDIFYCLLGLGCLQEYNMLDCWTLTFFVGEKKYSIQETGIWTFGLADCPVWFEARSIDWVIFILGSLHRQCGECEKSWETWFLRPAAGNTCKKTLIFLKFWLFFGRFQFTLPVNVENLSSLKLFVLDVVVQIITSWYYQCFDNFALQNQFCP